MKRLATCLLVTGFVLLILGGKLWLLSVAGSDLPVWDQWDAEGEFLLRPWLENRLDWAAIFHPHNEHHLVVSKLFALGLFVANGQWDALVETTANAFVHAASAVLLLAFGRQWLRGGWLAAYGALLVLLFTLPFSWENTLFGFQAQFYFLTLFSLGHVWFSLGESGFTPRWFIGQLLGALAIVTMASGFLSAGAVLVALLLRFARERRLTRQSIATAGIAFIFLLVGWCLRVEAAQHLALHAQSPGEFVAAWWQLLTWPASRSVLFGIVVVAPLLGFLVLGIRRPYVARDWVLFGFVAWGILQCAAIAFARGGGDVLASRYLDLLAINVALGFICLARHHSHRWFRLLTLGWMLVVVAGTVDQAVSAWRNDILADAASHLPQEKSVRDYLSTGNPAALLNQLPEALPYPVADVLLQRLSSPKIRDVMPLSVRRPVVLTGEVPSPPQEMPPGFAAAPRALAVSTWANDGKNRTLTWRSAIQSASTLPVLRLYLAGDLGPAGRGLQLVVRSDAGSVAVQPTEVAGEKWRALNIFRPAGSWWIEASATDPRFWFAFTQPVEMGRLSWLALKLAKNFAAIIAAGGGLLALGTVLNWRATGRLSRSAPGTGALPEP